MKNKDTGSIQRALNIIIVYTMVRLDKTVYHARMSNFIVPTMRLDS